MSFLDTLKGGAAGIAEKITGEHSKLLQEFIKLVQNMPGGVSGLVKQFQDKGLSQVASTLTGQGTAVVSPADIAQGLGSEKISALASSTGIDAKLVPEKLASILPEAMKQLTSAGKLAGVP